MSRLVPSTRRLFPLLAFLLIVVVICAAYLPALESEFVNWDDFEYIRDNTMIHTLDASHVRQMFQSLYAANWHPLTWLSHALDYNHYLLNPWGHHLTNVVLHALNVYLIFVLFRALRSDRPEDDPPYVLTIAALTALCFGLHPLRVESVAWISERKDLLCAFWALLTFIAYLRYARAEPDRRRLWFYLFNACLALALMSKPMAVTVPVALLILDAWPLKRLGSPAQLGLLIAEKIPAFLMCLFNGVLTLIAQKGAGAVLPIDRLGVGERLLNALHSYWFYIEKTLWPERLAPLYPFPKDLSLANPKIFFSLAVFIALTLLSFWLWQRGGKWFLAAWVYYLVSAAPIIGLVQVGQQAAADRYTYLPTLGVFFLLGAGAIRLWEWIAHLKQAFLFRSLFLACGLSGLALLSVLTAQQIGVWKNSETLWSHSANAFPGKLAMAHFNLGRVALDKERDQRALAHFKDALKIDPAFLDAHISRGLVLYRRGEYADAEKEFKATLKIKSDPIVHNNLGLVYIKQNRLALARSEYLVAIKADPNHLEARVNLAALHLKQGFPERAIKELQGALKIDFDFPLAHYGLGIIYRNEKNLARAILEFKLAIYLDPKNPDFRNALGMTYWLAGNLLGAREELEAALDLKPRHVKAGQNLAKLSRAMETKRGSNEFEKDPSPDGG